MQNMNRYLVCTIHHSPATFTLKERDKIENLFIDTEFHELDDLHQFPNQNDVDIALKEYYSRYNDFMFNGMETSEGREFIRYKYKSFNEEEYIYIDFYFDNPFLDYIYLNIDDK